MSIQKSMTGSLIVAFLLSLATAVSADVTPGDVIDHTNWEKVQGLVPDPMVEWVKTEKLVLPISELNLNPYAYKPPFVFDMDKTNIGKYGLDEAGGEIIERESGKMAKRVLGFPFPDVDPNDPQAAAKTMHNHEFVGAILGSHRSVVKMVWVGRSGFEREIEIESVMLNLVGAPKNLDSKNPEDCSKYSIVVVRKPFDLAGTAVMTHRFLSGKKRDNSFGYIPAIRRVRRMSAANRSDAFVGTDLCADDLNGYDGKVGDFEWKLLGKQEAIYAYIDAGSFPVVRTKRGEWATTSSLKKGIRGYEDEEWKGAPWAITNLSWVKRPAYVIEMKPKDPYYNYGTQYLWIDADNWFAQYKVIYDRSGKYWKTLIAATNFLESADGTMKATSTAQMIVVDDRSEHASISYSNGPDIKWTFFAELDPNDFSLAGFQKFCK